MRVGPTTVLLCTAAIFGACVNDQSTDAFDTTGTLADFSTYVQPVLAAGCTSLDCHGNAGRPLRLYARRGLRTEVALRGKDASDEEMLANMLAISGLDTSDTKIEDKLLLLKPLSVDAGGLFHKGGNLWPDQNDPVYRCLHAWLRSGVSDEAGRAVCTEALP